MIKRKFGNLEWNVSAVGLGTWNIGNQWGEIEESTAFDTVAAALDSGVNLVDTAESYGIPNGLSEERLGRALVGRRHQMVLVSKIGNWGKRTGQAVPVTTVDMIRLCADASLHRLRTDWHDVLLCHESDIEDPSVYLEGFDCLVQKGSLRAYGISTNDLGILKEFNRDGNCSVVQVDYSLLNREPSAEFLPYCESEGIAVMVRGPLAKGLLSGKYHAASKFSDMIRNGFNLGGERREEYERLVSEVEQIKEFIPAGQEMVTTALRYVFSHACQPVAIPGAKSAEQARINARAGDKLLSDAEWDQLKRAGFG